MIQQLQKKKLFFQEKTFNLKHAILIFDSGVGGLSIYNNIRQFLPNFSYIYVFDNLFFPYGNKNEEFILYRVIKIINTIHQQHCLELAVIACNTASVITLSKIRKHFKFPIIGVIPAIKSATYLATNNIIGLLATHITVNHSYTSQLIKNFADTYQIKMFSSSELVELAEAKLHGKTIQLESLRKILEPWIHASALPSVIVLGCTHFSFLKKELLSIFPKGIHFIDSHLAVTYQVIKLLKSKSDNTKSKKMNVAYCIKMTKKTEQLLSTLHYYGFQTLRELLF